MKTAKILCISVYVRVCVLTYLYVYAFTNCSHYGPMSWHTDRNPARDTRGSGMAQCRSPQTFLCKPPDSNHVSVLCGVCPNYSVLSHTAKAAEDYI